jgi:hypothetical protein
MNLAYRSQSEGAWYRQVRRHHKIYRRQGWDPCKPPTWQRPKGQWHKTTRKLCEQLNAGYDRIGAAMENMALFKGTAEIA